jgi:hypothetical protein
MTQGGGGGTRGTAPTVNHVGKLCLSEEAWEEKWKAHDSKKSLCGGPGGRGGWCSDCLNRGCENGANRDSIGLSSQGRYGMVKLGKDQCKHYFKNGHFSHKCKNRLKNEAAHIA